MPAQAATNNIYTVAGNGSDCCGFGEGGPATAADVAAPNGMAATPDGGFVMIANFGGSLKRVSPAGTITTVATSLNGAQGVAAARDGSFLVAESGSHRVVRVSPGGTITPVAGTGTPGFSGDGGPALGAQLNGPSDVAAAADGGFLIADYNNGRVRRVSPSGTIATVAGSGDTSSYDPSGDGGPATAARIRTPRGVAAAADGGFLVTDQLTSTVRRVSPAGAISTVAGRSGSSWGPGFSGDGGPATAARLNTPIYIAAAPDGGFVFADRGNNRVRRVAPDGRITTIAGNGTAGSAGDGGPGTAAQLNQPHGVAVTAEGGVLVTEFAGHRVRFVDTDLRAPGSGPAGQQGPAGPAGPAGPSGSTVTVRQLFAAFADEGLRARRRARLSLRYVATAASRGTIEVRRGRRSSGRRVGRALAVRPRAGRNRARLRAPAGAGTYTLVLRLRGSDGQVTSDALRLAVRR